MVLPEHIKKPQVYMGPGTWGPGGKLCELRERGLVRIWVDISHGVPMGMILERYEAG